MPEFSPQGMVQELHHSMAASGKTRLLCLTALVFTCLSVAFAENQSGLTSFGVQGGFADSRALSPASLKLPYAGVADFVRIREPSPPRPADSRQAMAKPFLQAAEGFSRQGRYDDSIRMLERGLELSPSNPDLLYAQAYLAYLAGGETSLSLEKMLEAEKSRDWYYTSLVDAQEFHCRLLFVMARYQELEDLLASRKLREQDPSFLYWSIRLRQAMPSIKGKDGLMERAFKLYPDQARFMVLKLLESPSLEFSDHQWFDSHHLSGLDWLDAQALRIRRLGPSEEQRQAIVDYLQAGGQDPWVYAWALVNVKEGSSFPPLPRSVSGHIPDLGEKSLATKLSTASGLQDLDVLRFLLARIPDLGRPEAGIWQTEKDFVLFRDADRDGFPEERISFSKGKPVLWSRDATQDGTGEFLMKFRDSWPVGLESRRDGKAYAYEYSAYPEISSALLETSGGSQGFLLHERALEIRILELPAEYGPDPMTLLDSLVLPPSFRLPDESNLTDEAFLVRRSIKGPRGPVSLERYEDGVKFVSLVDSDGDGVFEKIQVYNKGKPELSIESVDRPGIYDRFRFVDDQGREKILMFSPSASLRYRRESGLEVWDVNKDRSLDYLELSRMADETRRFFQEYL